MSITELPTNTARKFMAVSTKTNANLAGELADKITEIIHEYDDKIPLALAVGVLRIVESTLISEHTKD